MSTYSDKPEASFPNLTLRSFVVGSLGKCILTGSGAVRCTGQYASEGKTPKDVSFESVSRGCALTAKGMAYCWRKISDSSEMHDLVPVPGKLSFRSISGDGYRGCGVTVDGSAYCWGFDFSGQPNKDSKEDSNAPTLVPGKLAFQSVDVLFGYACGVTVAGDIYCWGTRRHEFEEDTNYGPIPRLIPKDAPLDSLRIIEMYRLERDFKQAWSEAEAALKKFPNEREVKRKHALLLADLGQPNQAIVEMRALLNGGKDRETYLDLATIYQKAKNLNEGLKALQQAETLSQSKEEKERISLRRADLYFNMRNYADAEVEYRKILQASPENTWALNNFGFMLAERNVRLQEAQELISRALKISPQDGDCLDSQGLIYDSLGKLDEAESYFRRAWESAAPNPVITEHLADVYFKKGKVKEAAARWREALQECETSAPVDVDPAQVTRIRKKLQNTASQVVK